jgi:hypothetical protein
LRTELGEVLEEPMLASLVGYGTGTPGFKAIVPFVGTVGISGLSMPLVFDVVLECVVVGAEPQPS